MRIFSQLALAGLALVSGVQGRDFTYYNYGAIEAEVMNMAAEYPNLVKVTNAQEAYGLPSAGSCGDFGDCKQYIVHLTNFKTYDAEKDVRPQVFFSGCLHGDERVGPTTLVEFVKLLTSNYEKSSPNPWLKRLVDTRSIYVMPSPNALGYYQDRRTENGIDPNRDFPIDLLDDTECMQTIAARSINELWREQMFQLSITFHSGTRMLGYEWGDVTHEEDFYSPDDASQAAIGSALSAFAGKFDAPSPVADFPPGGFPPFPELFDRLTYPNGPITPLVYPVRGGMEDWGYAGSWADNILTCDPQTYGGYPREKTTYTDSMLRVFNMLVESDDDKEPAENTLGSDAELLKPSGSGIGHIPRHIRLVLMMTEAVQPYIKIVSFRHGIVAKCEKSFVSRDIDTSMLYYDDVNYNALKLSAPILSTLTLSYEVGGSFTVDSTKIQIFKKPRGFDFEKVSLTEEDFKSLTLVAESEEMSGYTRWSGGGLFGSEESESYQGFLEAYAELNLSATDGIDDRENFPFIPAWKACVKAPVFPGEYILVATAVVDQNWGEIPEDAVPKGLGLQAHVSQARTNSSWLMENNGFKIQGQKQWYSKPIALKVYLPGFSHVESAEEEKKSEDASMTVEIYILGVGCVGLLVSMILMKFKGSKSNQREAPVAENSDGLRTEGNPMFIPV